MVSPVNNYSTSETRPTFSWNAPDVPDLDYYQLYIDGNLTVNNISGTSVTLTTSLSCGSHTWYVKAVDKAGNSTQSASTFIINIICPGAGSIPLPQNTRIVGDLLADFMALSGGKELEKFEGVVPITFTYTDEQVREAGVDEKTLKIYWWDKSSKTWKPLESKVNTLTNSITAYTIHFTLFTVIGEIKEKLLEEMTIEEILTKMIETLKKLIQVYTQLIQLQKG